jgi:predicted NBD/HSP70 family sugar kinase
MPVFVGCDLGTMGTKAAVVDGDGKLLGDAFEEVPLRSPRPGWVEQDLEEIEASAHRTIRAALAASGRARATSPGWRSPGRCPASAPSTSASARRSGSTPGWTPAANRTSRP